MARVHVPGILLLLAAGLLLGGCTEDPPADDAAPRYLLFQLFTFAPSPDGTATPLDSAQLQGVIDDILATLGDERGDGRDQQLGFSIGPLTLDHTDDEMRAQIDAAFDLAEHNNLAVAIHIDDSMFWMRRSDLWMNPDNVEWTDWSGTVHPHLRIGWAPTVLAPKMCYASPAIRAEIERIATDVIGAAVKRRVDRLRAAGKLHLFAGVIAGWETRMQDDSQPPVELGYCSLHHLGFSAAKPPASFDAELSQVVHDWAELWVDSLAAAGVPTDRLYTHLPVVPEPSTINAPPEAAFNDSSRAGFSIYPGPDPFEPVYAELATQGESAWAMAEGTNAQIDGNSSTLSWESYLARLYGHGAVLVNVFAWQDPTALGMATRAGEAVTAYSKFLRGAPLTE